MKTSIAHARRALHHVVLATLAAVSWNARASEVLLGDEVTSNAIAIEGVVLFGTSDSRLYAIEAESGRPVWSTDELKLGPLRQLLTHGRFSILHGNGTVVAVDLRDGSVAWKRVVGRDLGHGEFTEIINAFTTNHNIVAFLEGGSVVVLEHETGKIVAVKDLGERTSGEPVVAGEQAWIVVPGQGAIGIRFGEKTIVATASVSFPAIERADLFSTTLLLSGHQGQYLGVDPVTGRIRWTRSWPSRVSPLDGVENILLLNDERGISAVDLTNGTAKWSLPGQRIAQVLPCVDLSKVERRFLYISNDDFGSAHGVGVSRVRVQDGAILWTRSFPGKLGSTRTVDMMPGLLIERFLSDGVGSVAAVDLLDETGRVTATTKLSAPLGAICITGSGLISGIRTDVRLLKLASGAIGWNRRIADLRAALRH